MPDVAISRNMPLRGVQVADPLENRGMGHPVPGCPRTPQERCPYSTNVTERNATDHLADP